MMKSGIYLRDKHRGFAGVRIELNLLSMPFANPSLFICRYEVSAYFSNRPFTDPVYKSKSYRRYTSRRVEK